METLSSDIPDGLQTAIRCVLDTACDKGARLATAESCTGGLLASVLTDVEGASHAFDRAFVVYTDAAKREMLGVEAGLLNRHGAVSAPVARAMAEGALDRADATVALSVTGFAGPGDANSEEGLVHFACARSDRPTRLREEHFGPLGRGAIRVRCLEVAVEMLKEALE